MAVGQARSSRPPRPGRPTTRRSGAPIRGRSGRWPSGCRGSAAAGPDPAAGPAGAVRPGDRPATGAARRRRGTGWAGPTTPPWPGWAPRDEAGLREALATFDDLGARAAAAAARRRMKDLGITGDPARAPPGHPGRPGRADRPRAGGPGAARGGPARPGDLPAAVHLRADRAPPRLRGAVQDRRLVPDRRRPRGRPDGHRRGQASAP